MYGTFINCACSDLAFCVARSRSRGHGCHSRGVVPRSFEHTHLLTRDWDYTCLLGEPKRETARLMLDQESEDACHVSPGETVDKKQFFPAFLFGTSGRGACRLRKAT